MPETVPRPQAKLDPAPAWTVLTDAPLKGLSLAREAGVILAWDEGDQLYLLDLDGRHRSVVARAGRIVAGAISDDGSLVALLGEGPRLWLLRPDLVADRREAGAPRGDVPGRRPARPVRRGRLADRPDAVLPRGTAGPAGRFETRQALPHLAFVPDRPFLIGAAAYGLLVGVELAPAERRAARRRTSPGRSRSCRTSAG